MLRKIRIAMGHRDSLYRLHDLIEIDDALIGVDAVESVGVVRKQDADSGSNGKPG